MPYPLLAVDVNEGWAGGVFAGLVLLVGAVGTWLLKLREANNALTLELEKLRIELEKVRQGGRTADGEAEHRADAAKFEQFQAQMRTANERIEHLEEVNERSVTEIRQLMLMCAECQAREAGLIERIRWLELNPGKSPPQAGSGSHRPLGGHEGADV